MGRGYLLPKTYSGDMPTKKGEKSAQAESMEAVYQSFLDSGWIPHIKSISKKGLVDYNSPAPGEYEVIVSGVHIGSGGRYGSDGKWYIPWSPDLFPGMKVLTHRSGKKYVTVNVDFYKTK